MSAGSKAMGEHCDWHKSITADRITEACERRLSSLDNPGFCIACGADADGVEPDARGYECEICGEQQVFGADELLFDLPASELFAPAEGRS